MEVKEERVDGQEAHESYAMLTESDAITREQRALRREICISRITIFILLITCMTFCVILYIQQFHGSKNNENMNKEKAKETWAEFQIGNQGANLLDVQTPPIASLSTNSTNKTLTWWPYHKRMNDNFCLHETCEFLTIPQDGKYRLGLQITYMEKDPQEGQILLQHKIIKYPDSYPDPVTILSVSETIYKKSSWCKSMFSEVIHVFNKLDRIKVESNHPTLIDGAGRPWTKNLLTIQFVSRIRD